MSTVTDRRYDRLLAELTQAQTELATVKARLVVVPEERRAERLKDPLKKSIRVRRLYAEEEALGIRAGQLREEIEVLGEALQAEAICDRS